MTRVALVAGGGGTIGGAIAARLAAGGASVISADRTFAQAPGEGIEQCVADLADARQIAALVEGAIGRHGRLDILVCAAGVTSLGAFGSITPEEWDWVHAINLRGVFLLMQAAAAPMRAAGSGRIVVIGSVLGKNGGNPRPWLDRAEQERTGNAAYGASKAGVHALTFYLAKELASDGVTVNAVAPGPIASPMTTSFPRTLVDQVPAGRMGTATEVASAVAWLCGDEAGFVTGEIIDVNGGLWMD